MSKHNRDNPKYYARLKLLRKVKNLAEEKLTINTPVHLDPPIAYTYRPRTLFITHIERHRYTSMFKRVFTPVRLIMDDGSHVNVEDLKMKHLLALYKFFTN